MLTGREVSVNLAPDLLMHSLHVKTVSVNSFDLKDSIDKLPEMLPNNITALVLINDAITVLGWDLNIAFPSLTTL